MNTVQSVEIRPIQSVKMKSSNDDNSIQTQLMTINFWTEYYLSEFEQAQICMHEVNDELEVTTVTPTPTKKNSTPFNKKSVKYLI